MTITLETPEERAKWWDVMRGLLVVGLNKPSWADGAIELYRERLTSGDAPPQEPSGAVDIEANLRGLLAHERGRVREMCECVHSELGGDPEGEVFGWDVLWPHMQDFIERQRETIEALEPAQPEGGDAPPPEQTIRALVREHGRTQVEEWARGVHPPRGAPQEPSEPGLVQKMARACIDASQGAICDADPYEHQTPLQAAEETRDRCIKLYQQVAGIYGDRAEGLGGAYGDAFDVIEHALADLATVYRALDVGQFDDMDDALASRAALGAQS